MRLPCFGYQNLKKINNKIRIFISFYIYICKNSLCMRIYLTLISLLAFAINGLAQSSSSCHVDSLNISIGYDPVGDSIVSPPVHDPKWTSAVSVAAADSILSEGDTIGCYDIVPLPPIFWTSSSSCDWMSGMNTWGYYTNGSGADIFWMRLTRTFQMCSSDSILLNVNIATDDWISSIKLDGTYLDTTTATPCGAISFSPYSYSLGLLTAGTHTLSITVHNCNNGYYLNATGMALYGYVYSASGKASFLSEHDTSYTCSCSSIADTVCNTISMPDTLKTCQNSNIALSATITGTDSVLSILWSPATGLSDTTVKNPLLTVDTISRIYYITMKSLLPGGDTCITKDSIYIKVNLLPVVNLGPDTSICSGTIILQSSDTYTSPSYLWNTGSTASSININTSGAYWLEVTVNGCKGSDTVNVFFPNVISISDSIMACQNSIVTLSPTITGSDSILSILWSPATGLSNTTVKNPLLTVDTISRTYFITIEFLSPNGNTCIVKDSVYIKVSLLPAVNLGPDTSICSGTITLYQRKSSYSYPYP